MPALRTCERRYQLHFVGAILFRKLVGQDGDLVNSRRLSQQFTRFRHQRCGDLAIEMRVASGLVVKGIENRE
jgi:hypothetical protein